MLNPRLKPAVTGAASRSVSVVRPDAYSLPVSEARAASVAVVAVQAAFPQEGCVGAANARSEEASLVSLANGSARDLLSSES